MKIQKESAIPIYLQVKQIIESSINDGEFKIDDRIPSENQLGLKYNINRLTARRSLLELENEGLVYSVPGKGRFVGHKRSSTSAKSAPKLKNKQVGIYGGDADFLNSNFYSGFLNQINTVLFNRGQQLKFLCYNDLEQLLKTSTSTREKLQGIIILSPRKTDLNLIRYMVDMDTPVVVANRLLPETSIPYIAIDQYSGSQQLVTLLLEAGHRRIGCITVDRSIPYSLRRWQGYCDALKLKNIEVDPKLLLELVDIEVDFSVQLHEFFMANNDLTAVFVAGESLQHQVMTYFKTNNKRIPEDYSAVAFGKTDFGEGFPKITCVQQPLEEMADRIISMLDRIHIESTGNITENEILPTKIILNESIRKISL